jgi:hypothetical protein
MFADLERQWDQALLRKPQKGETIEEVAREQQERDLENRGDVIIDLQIVVGGEGEHHERQEIPDIPQAPAQNQEDHAQVDGPDGEIIRQPAPDGHQLEVQAREQAAEERNGQRGRAAEWRQDNALQGSTTSLIGALFFPAVSSLMGDLLKVALPNSWARKPATSAFPFWAQKNNHFNVGIRGLLQEKWGRSIVGGCLFIVLKDALILYCKWRKAQIQKKRRVLDYVQREPGAPRGVLGRIIGGASFL